MMRYLLVAAIIFLIALSMPSVSAWVDLQDKSVDELIELLTDADQDVRAQAASDLGNRGRYAMVAIPALIEALHDEYSGVVKAAAHTLGELGPEPGVVDALIELLDGGNDYLMGAAADALSDIGPDAVDAVPKLMEILASDISIYESHFIEALGNIGPAAEDAIPIVMKHLGGYVGYDETTATALIKIGPAAIPYLIEAFQIGDRETREGAAYCLGELGPDSIEALPLLIEAIRQDEINVAIEATYAAGKISTTPDVIDLLIDTLLYEDSKLRKAAAEALGDIGSGPGILDALIKAVDDEDSNVRDAAIKSLEKFGPEAKDAVPALIRAVESGSTYAIITLGEIGPDAVEAIPAIIATVKPKSPQYGVTTALEKIAIGSDEAVAALIGLLSHPVVSARQSAAYALGRIDPTPDIVNALARTLGSDGDDSVRSAIIYALKGFGPEAADAIPVIVEVIKENNPELDEFAADAFAAIAAGIDRPTAEIEIGISLLSEALDSDDLEVRRKTVDILKSMPSAAPFLMNALDAGDEHFKSLAVDILSELEDYRALLIPYIIELLNSDDSVVRQSAIRTAGKIGPAAKDTVPTLISILQEVEYRNRRSVIWTLADIGPEPGVVDALITALDDDDPCVSCPAAGTLGDFGADAVKAVPALIETLRGGNERVRGYAAYSLVEIAPDRAELIPEMYSAMDEESCWVKVAAAYGVYILDKGSTDGLQACIDALKNDDYFTNMYAANVIAEMGMDAKDAVPALIEELTYDPDAPRGYCIIALGRMGEYAADALPILRGIADDDERIGLNPEQPTIGDRALEAIALIEAALQDDEVEENCEGTS